MNETKIPVGSWLGDLGGMADTLITKAEALVDKYKDQAGAMYDASRKIAHAVQLFIAKPGFDTGAILYTLVMAFPVPVMGDGKVCVATTAKFEALDAMEAINWANLAKFALTIADLISKFL